MFQISTNFGSLYEVPEPQSICSNMKSTEGEKIFIITIRHFMSKTQPIKNNNSDIFILKIQGYYFNTAYKFNHFQEFLGSLARAAMRQTSRSFTIAERPQSD